MFLQRMSLIIFRTKIMPHSCTIRMNPSIYSAFNIEFDRDEISTFYVSLYLSKVECVVLFIVDNCILSPQNFMLIVYVI